MVDLVKQDFFMTMKISSNRNQKLFTNYLGNSKNFLAKSLPALTGHKVNMMGGLFKAPVQAQSHYISIVSAFENIIAVASTKMHGNISKADGN